MLENEVLLTSSSGSGDDEQHRIKRLERALKIYIIQVEALELESYTKLNSLHDHKGTLTVSWKNNPNNVEKELIQSIWELQWELAENVDHEVVN